MKNRKLKVKGESVPYEVGKFPPYPPPLINLDPAREEMDAYVVGEWVSREVNNCSFFPPLS